MKFDNMGTMRIDEYIKPTVRAKLKEREIANTINRLIYPRRLWLERGILVKKAEEKVSVA